MSFELAQAQYDSMEPNWDECPVCEDLEECECDFEGTRLAAALAHADNRLKEINEGTY